VQPVAGARALATPKVTVRRASLIGVGDVVEVSRNTELQSLFTNAGAAAGATTLIPRYKYGETAVSFQINKRSGRFDPAAELGLDEPKSATLREILPPDVQEITALFMLF